MHILIGIITAVAGLVWALHSLQNAGVNLNAFNPFTWMRRRRWEKQLGTKPMHGLTDSMDAVALLVVSIAKEEGDITKETKMEVLRLFESAFGVSRGKAIEMFSSSCYMLKDVLDMSDEVRHVLRPTKEQFKPAQIDKTIDMLNKIANIEGAPTESQQSIIQAVSHEFECSSLQPKSW